MHIETEMHLKLCINVCTVKNKLGFGILAIGNMLCTVHDVHVHCAYMKRNDFIDVLRLKWCRSHTNNMSG